MGGFADVVELNWKATKRFVRQGCRWLGCSGNTWMHSLLIRLGIADPHGRSCL